MLGIDMLGNGELGGFWLNLMALMGGVSCMYMIRRIRDSKVEK